MIGRKSQRNTEPFDDDQPVVLKGFDDYEQKLGDMMRGERATLGKSLLDVQRELRIKAAYIAAIENSDPSAFDTPGFIAGYVRSYARYLNLDPDETFATFCAESGFSVAHGMSPGASSLRRDADVRNPAKVGPGHDPFAKSNLPYAPVTDIGFGGVDLRAFGSVAVLLAVIGGIGYGGFAVLRQIQQVTVAPVEQAPVVLTDLDPLDGAATSEDEETGEGTESSRTAALDRLYRPAALDVPVLVARDAPISTLDPREQGVFASPSLHTTSTVTASRAGPHGQISETPAPPVPQVVENTAPALRMVAVRPSWVRVRAADGTVIFEGIMEAGDSYDVPATEEPPTLRAGESGAIYFALGGTHYGPVGDRGRVTSNLPLSMDTVTERYQVADLEQDRDLARMVAEAQAVTAQPPQPGQ